ncbi:hypothetical protein V8F06_013394 [Rhypophila decipiens]
MSSRGGMLAMLPLGSRSLLLLTLLFILQASPAFASAMRSTSQFQQWYQQYGYVFDSILHNNCTEQYENYRTGVVDPNNIDRLGGGSGSSALTQPVIACIMSNTGEYIKSQLSAAQVLLGVAPTVLAILGPRGDEMGTLLLVGRRPFLFLILACGSPSVYFGRAFEYVSPKTFLADRIHAQTVLKRQEFLPVSGAKRTPLTNAIATGVEYFLAIAAVANIVFLDYELGAKTVCIIWSATIFAPLAWGATGIFNYVLCALMLRTRIRRLDADETATGENKGFMAWAKRWNARRFWRDWLASEIKMSATQKHIRIDEFEETHSYVVLSWLSSVCIISHVLFGTLVFSSTVFIGPEDALGVVVRYMISVMICRMVLMYELMGLRDAYALSNPEIMTSGSVGFAKEVLPASRVEEYENGNRNENGNGMNKRATAAYFGANGDELGPYPGT